MHLSKLTIENFRCFGAVDNKFVLVLKTGLTALVGENDSGKTAVIDALRFIFGTTDQEWYRLEDTDFHEQDTSKEITIVCKFIDLNSVDKRAFAEFLTYEDEPVLYVNWVAKESTTARRGRFNHFIEIRSGKNGEGPVLEYGARDLLRATYLRPLRDAEQALSSGRGSRLAQVLHNTKSIKSSGVEYSESVEPKDLNVRGIGDLANGLLEKQEGIKEVRCLIDGILDVLSLHGDTLSSTIRVSGAKNTDDARLRSLLEKLDLTLGGDGRLGLGSNNLLFMACELLLLAQEEDGNKLLLIEEPEAHLHSQRQLRAMRFLELQAKEKGIQIIVTTHSPNLASTINLKNMVIIQNGYAFSLDTDSTELDEEDYRFLQRFLDVTKANLFFARGVMIVEGDAENILIPTLAKLIGHDFTEYGVSIVNVGGVGLRRYAKIFQRQGKNPRALDTPVACVTDMDVMPNCAPEIISKVKAGEQWPENRKWKVKKDFEGDGAIETLADRKRKIEEKAQGQCVRSFVSDEWTLEYDLAYSGLAEEVYIAAYLAKKEKVISDDTLEKETADARTKYQQLLTDANGKTFNECTKEEYIASNVYAMFTTGTKASKSITAQYLAESLEKKHEKGELTSDSLLEKLPKYLINAVKHVTPKPNTENSDQSTDEPGK